MKLSSLNVSSKNHQQKATKCSSISDFKTELKAITQLKIFTAISDCGYFGWRVSAKMNQPLILSNIQATTEITRHIVIDKVPQTLLSLKDLKVPCSFEMSLEPDLYKSTYPYGQYDVASLYVASKHRKVDLDDMDFMFGGSTLELLATADDTTASSYLVCRIPTTKNEILVRKCKEYVQNFSDVGYQFERYVTTGIRINGRGCRICRTHASHGNRTKYRYKIQGFALR
jgi:hypothetical protein